MKKSLIILVVPLLLLAFTGVAEGGTVSIKVGASGNTFSPKSKGVAKGTKVKWCNSGNTTHTVTAYSGSWNKNTSLGGSAAGTGGGTGGGWAPQAKAGSCTSFAFKKTGTFKYRCTIHSTLSGNKCSGMCGVIKVN